MKQKILELLKKAVEQEEEKFRKEKEAADWHNNNMPGVGDTLPYVNPEPMPEWAYEARKIIDSSNL